MNTQIVQNIRQGIIALPLAGLLFLTGLLLRGQPADDPRRLTFDPTHFAQAVTTAGYSIGWPILIGGMVLLIFGYAALYGYLTNGRAGHVALIAMLLGITGSALQIGIFGIFAFVYAAIGHAYLSGQINSIELLSTLFTGPLTTYIMVAGLAYLTGTILFAVAIWRSQKLPRWAGICLPIYYLLLLAPAFQLTGTVAFTLELLGAVLLLVAGGAIAREVRQS